jgi:hypothetical protein
MIIGFLGAVTFVLCEVIVILKVARMFVPPGPLAGEIRNLSLRSLVTLGLTLVLCNGLVFYLTDLRPRLVWAAAVSVAVVVSWISARWVARRREGGTHDHRDT